MTTFDFTKKILNVHCLNLPPFDVFRGPIKRGRDFSKVSTEQQQQEQTAVIPISARKNNFKNCSELVLSPVVGQFQEESHRSNIAGLKFTYETAPFYVGFLHNSNQNNQVNILLL